MSCSRASLLALLVLLLASLLAASSPSLEEDFIQCLRVNSRLIPIPFSTTFFTRKNPAFTSVLNSTAMNFRYLLPSVPKPVFIFTPLHESHVQAAVICSKELDVHLRLRSGGHDYEGVSYAATVNDNPFMVLDFQRLRSVSVSIEDETAWVEAGATVGELYYKIAEKSNVHAFPAESDIKKFNAWQHVADKLDDDLLVKVTMQSTDPDEKGERNVTILYQGLFLGEVDRLLEMMAKSFPEFGLSRADCQEMTYIESTVLMGGYPNGTSTQILLEDKSILRTYFKSKSDFARDPIPETAIQDLWRRLRRDTGVIIFTPYGGMMSRISESATPFAMRNGTKYMIAYTTLWQDGEASEATHLKWIRSMYVLPSVPKPLFIFTPLHESYAQAAVICSKQFGVHPRIHSGGHDYEGVSYAATVNDHPFMVLDFQRLRSVSINIEDETEWVEAGATLGEFKLFSAWQRAADNLDEDLLIKATMQSTDPNEKGERNVTIDYQGLFLGEYLTVWRDRKATEVKHMKWIRSMQKFMEPDVTKNPRTSYDNYRDLDLWMNEEGNKSCFKQASSWHYKYFKGNFNRLVQIKSKVDPGNFLWHEQSIPPVSQRV
ncbi:hypothetical protein Cgig2_022018 [Carnegiea gigantea]|uniref:FAD-binding PCMH-type domain-containing protein n=1 Tax=Carnegiea gigantea TaxID=171969 RepID=A0A9Q1KSR4_9CARY|nr:hypothetical protein Cgig2_022018 [Carnegiea gigantea]